MIDCLVGSVVFASMCVAAYAWWRGYRDGRW